MIIKAPGRQIRSSNSRSMAMNKVLILGSSYIARPVVSYLSQFQTIDMTIASNQLNQAEEIASKYSRTKAVELSVHDTPKLSQLISKHHLVISLVPFRIHLPVAKSCIQNKVNMLTASYLNPELKELHQQALEANITMFNEIGFDPGIDHMLAMQCFDEARDKGGKVRSYVSWCTGLPAPEAANVPLKYKFSWSPLAVLLNSLNPAKCLLAGETITVPEGGELMKHPQNVDMSGVIQGVQFEGIYNRDSFKYVDLYKIPDVHTLMRGTLRYKGFCATMRGLQLMGLIDSEQHPKLQPGSSPITWEELTADLMGTSVITLKDEVLKRIDENKQVMEEIEAMGLLSSKQVPLMGSPAHSLAEHLLTMLSYKAGERDMVILHDIIDIEWPNNTKERKTITMIEFGDLNGLSAMAKAVGIPTGIAAKLILEGKIKHKGIVLPLTKDIYQPILEELNGYIKSPTTLSTFYE